MKSKKEKSIVRARAAAITFAGLIGGTVSSIIDPITGGLVAGGMGVLLEHLSKWHKDDQEYRLNEFHKKVFEGLSLKQRRKLGITPFGLDDYYSFLKNLVADEEKEKVDIYARIFRALIQGKIDARFKMLIVRSARELKLSDFVLLNEYYVSQKNDLQIKKIAVSIDPAKLHSIQNLIHYGYLSDKDGTRPPCPTELLDCMAVLIRE